MLHQIAHILVFLMVLVIATKLALLYLSGYLKNKKLAEHSLLFIFSKATIKNSFHRSLSGYMRKSNWLTILFYLLLLGYVFITLFEQVVLLK